MSKSIISEGKTSTEAIENGLKELKATKDMVNVEVLENEDKRSFFSILTPRVVKVKIELKEKYKANNQETKEVKKEFVNEITDEEFKVITKKIEEFLKGFLENLKIENLKYSVCVENYIVNVKINGEKINYLIGYRGEVLNSLQVIISSIANKGINKRCKVVLDIEGYRKKREKTLKELAEKVSKTVMKTKKSITLEPMSAYERKIIHSKLQENSKIKTYSIGEEPNRKLVISIK